MLKISRSDPHLVYKLRREIQDACRKAKGGLRRELADLLSLVWDNYHDVGEKYDLAYRVGRMSYALGEYQRAESLLQVAGKKQTWWPGSVAWGGAPNILVIP